MRSPAQPATAMVMAYRMAVIPPRRTLVCPIGNATACQNDIDGDGVPNVTDPFPMNPCLPNANAVVCATGDADGDGVPNGSDPAPLNPCVPNANAIACATGDGDGDRVPNGSDPRHSIRAFPI